MVYKTCVVPQCTSSYIRTPEKLFLSVPTNPKRRKLWLRLARRDPESFTSHSNIFMCEDHFDMEKDTMNYRQYIMGLSHYILLTKEAVPTKFHCQEDRKTRMLDASPTRAAFLKRQRKDLVAECLQRQSATETLSEHVQQDDMEQDIHESEETAKTRDKQTITNPILTADKSVQLTSKVNKHYRSKAVQARTQIKSICTSPIKCSTTTRFTSPFKIEPCRSQPSLAGVVEAVKRNILLEEEKSDSDISFAPMSLSRVTDSDSYVTDTNESMEQLESLKNTLRIIAKKPMMYVGIPAECYYLVEQLHRHTNIKIEHILLCLKKIRMNRTFSELGDDFGVSLSYASKIFVANIPIISSVLRPFIVNLDKKLIKKNLPIAFRHNYHNVSCIIDCLEIDVQKPSKSLHQVMTWSAYKKGNTVKYLISCTPNGLVNYISRGFGGRTSDVTIVENCDFVDGLQLGTAILADRGFKHLEQILSEKGMKLLRPPSVSSGAKLSKAEVRQTKIIASLRIHIERVIRRVREFHMLKLHSVINTNILRVLDHALIIACALINLQDSLIKL